MNPENTRLIESVIERGWNRGELEALDDSVAVDYVRHLSDGRTLRSREEFKEHIRSIRAAMPDLRSDVRLSLSDGPLRATTFSFSATVDGAPVSFEGAVVVRVEDGKLAEEWEFFNSPRR